MSLIAKSDGYPDLFFYFGTTAGPGESAKTVNRFRLFPPNSLVSPLSDDLTSDLNVISRKSFRGNAVWIRTQKPHGVSIVTAGANAIVFEQ